MAVQDAYTDNMVIGLAGQLADLKNSDKDGVLNGEASAEMPFGFAVVFDGANDNQALLPAAATDDVMGLVIHSHAYEGSGSGELGATGVKAGGMVNVLRKGSMYAICQDGCVAGDPLFIRFQNGDGAGSLLAATAGADDMTTVTTAGRWKTTAAAGELALLEVDFINQ